ncbi:MAG: tetratricopeptide repeat protein [Candidatus Hydrogenedentes bacterium]|nr:tetratricopeptide repeat protein [Candidatus Hydrogenedentota bacterium]
MGNGNMKQLFQQAGQLYQAKRYPDALRLLDQLAQQAPGNVEVLYARALCLGALGKVPEAVEICEMLANVYGDARGAQLRARLTQPGRAAAPSPARAPAAKPAAPGQRAGAPAKKSSGNLVLVAVLVVLVAGAGGAYYYLNFMHAEEAPAGAAAAPVARRAQPQAVNGIFGDPNGVKLAATNETGGVLDVWLGDVGATSVPLASFQAGSNGTIGIAAGKQKVRLRADWGNVRFHTAIQDIDISAPQQLVFFREFNPMGIPEVKWRVQ